MMSSRGEVGNNTVVRMREDAGNIDKLRVDKGAGTEDGSRRGSGSVATLLDSTRCRHIGDLIGGEGVGLVLTRGTSSCMTF